jgi:hypothetical protein
MSTEPAFCPDLEKYRSKHRKTFYNHESFPYKGQPFLEYVYPKINNTHYLTHQEKTCEVLLATRHGIEIAVERGLYAMGIINMVARPESNMQLFPDAHPDTLAYIMEQMGGIIARLPSPGKEELVGSMDGNLSDAAGEGDDAWTANLQHIKATVDSFVEVERVPVFTRRPVQQEGSSAASSWAFRQPVAIKTEEVQQERSSAASGWPFRKPVAINTEEVHIDLVDDDCRELVVSRKRREREITPTSFDGLTVPDGMIRNMKRMLGIDKVEGRLDISEERHDISDTRHDASEKNQKELVAQIASLQQNTRALQENEKQSQSIFAELLSRIGIPAGKPALPPPPPDTFVPVDIHSLVAYTYMTDRSKSMLVKTYNDQAGGMTMTEFHKKAKTSDNSFQRAAAAAEAEAAALASGKTPTAAPASGKPIPAAAGPTSGKTPAAAGPTKSTAEEALRKAAIDAITAQRAAAAKAAQAPAAAAAPAPAPDDGEIATTGTYWLAVPQPARLKPTNAGWMWGKENEYTPDTEAGFMHPDEYGPGQTYALPKALE